MLQRDVKDCWHRHYLFAVFCCPPVLSVIIVPAYHTSFLSSCLVHTRTQSVADSLIAVVDVYQQWCGPCRAVVSLLRKIKNELGDDLLHFATVRRVNKKYEEFKIFREGPLKLCV